MLGRMPSIGLVTSGKKSTLVTAKFRLKKKKDSHISPITTCLLNECNFSGVTWGVPSWDLG